MINSTYSSLVPFPDYDRLLYLKIQEEIWQVSFFQSQYLEYTCISFCDVLRIYIFSILKYKIIKFEVTDVKNYQGHYKIIIYLPKHHLKGTVFRNNYGFLYYYFQPLEISLRPRTKVISNPSSFLS